MGKSVELNRICTQNNENALLGHWDQNVGNMSGACHTSNVGNAMCALLATSNTKHTTKWTVMYSVQYYERTAYKPL